ncbi:BLOC-1-related complex subunit 5-like [Watersipora subatra]|uniref:BLOC-1-related complex subunit 5-like n=1 Tax=Watersipora subatra TaxID=2589382 RepID=UPI00355B43E2
MFNWLREKVSREPHAGTNVQYENLSKDEDGKSTLVVVRDGAVPKMTLDSNELQLLRDIPEFKPLLVEGVPQSLPKMNTKSVLAICKTYQDHLQVCGESVATEQRQISAKMKEVDLAVKVMMDRLTERQKAYAKAAEQLKKTSDITQSLKKMRTHVMETEEMLRQLNEELPEYLRLQPYTFSVETQN